MHSQAAPTLLSGNTPSQHGFNFSHDVLAVQGIAAVDSALDWAR